MENIRQSTFDEKSPPMDESTPTYSEPSINAAKPKETDAPKPSSRPAGEAEISQIGLTYPTDADYLPEQDNH